MRAKTRVRALVLPAIAATVTLRAAAASAATAAAATGAGTDLGPINTGLGPIDAATSLLVVSPHPDDETLCCAGAIQRVLRAGGQAAVVWVTSGDAERDGLLALARLFHGGSTAARDLGARRMSEARAATALLGVPPRGQLFLGYPDGGLGELLGAHRSTAYTSAATAAAVVPYGDALYPGHAYTGEELTRDFAAVLARIRPTLILAPCASDSHPDHRAAGELAMAMNAGRAPAAQLRCWIVHGGEGWPSPRELSAGIPLTPAPLARGAVPSTFALRPAEEDRKLLALRTYRSQMRTMAPFLLAFVRTTELFWIPAAAAPP